MDWREHLPYLARQIAENNVWRYDSYGFTRELTPYQEDKIKEIEDENKDLRVVAILDAVYQFPDCERYFNTYLLLGENDMPEIANFDGKDYVIFYSYVANMDDSTCSEYGNVGVLERVGRLIRIY